MTPTQTDSEFRSETALPCDIVGDLIPLAADNVASEASREAVLHHIETCEACRELYEACREPADKPPPALADKQIMGYIRRRAVYLFALLALTGAAAGVMILNTPLVFQNFLLMPAVGVLSYVCFREKGALAAVAVILLTLLKGLIDRESPLILGLILALLVLTGVLIAALLNFALQRDKGRNGTGKEKYQKGCDTK